MYRGGVGPQQQAAPTLLGPGRSRAGGAASKEAAAAFRNGRQQLRVPPRVAAPPPGAAAAGTTAAAPPRRSPYGLAAAAAAAAPAVGGGRPRQGRAHIDESNEVVAFLKQAGLQMYAIPLLDSGFDDMETFLQIEDADMKDVGMPAYHVARLRKRLQELQRDADVEPQVDENHPVVAFLEDVGLGQYAPALLQNGFDEMDTLLDMDELDMRDLNIPRGHALKLRKRLHEYQLHHDAQDEPVYLQPTNQRAMQHLQVPPPQAARPAAPVAEPTPPAAACHPPVLGGAAALPSDSMKSAVVQSWERVQIRGTFAVGELLYRHTFALCPEAVELFPPEVRAKYRLWNDAEGDSDDGSAWESTALRNLFAKVLNAVGCSVAGLHDFAKLVPMLTKLGARHIHYGPGEEHWPVLGKALDLTLSDILGEAYTPEVQNAWTMVYGFMSSIMIEGLRTAKQQQQQLQLQQQQAALDSESRETGPDEDAMTQASATLRHRSVSEAGEEAACTPSSMLSR